MINRISDNNRWATTTDNAISCITLKPLRMTTLYNYTYKLTDNKNVNSSNKYYYYYY